MMIMHDIEVQIRLAERRIAEVERDIEDERRYLENVVKSELMNASGIVDSGVRLGKLYEKRELLNDKLDMLQFFKEEMEENDNEME